MGAVTSAALGAAAAAGTLSTGLGIGSLAVGAAGTTASFIQARRQRNKIAEAKRDAEKFMADARSKLDINFYDEVPIQKQVYETQREGLLSQGAQAIQAGVEGDRGAAATAGRVQMAMNEAQAGISAVQEKELSDLAKLSAQEDSRLRDVGIQLDLAEVEGAQQAIADAEQARAAAIQQGMAGIQSVAQQGIAMAPLYMKNLGAQKDALSKMEFTPEEFAKFESLGGNAIQEGEFSSLDFKDFANMSNADYRKYLNKITPQQRQMLFQNQQYLQNYNPFQPY
jgi:hypothetical protein